MSIFVKFGTKENLIRKEEAGGGFVTVEVLVTKDLNLTEPDPEARKYWVELGEKAELVPNRVGK